MFPWHIVIFHSYVNVCQRVLFVGYPWFSHWNFQRDVPAMFGYRRLPEGLHITSHFQDYQSQTLQLFPARATDFWGHLGPQPEGISPGVFFFETFMVFYCYPVIYRWCIYSWLAMVILPTMSRSKRCLFQPLSSQDPKAFESHIFNPEVWTLGSKHGIDEHRLWMELLICFSMGKCGKVNNGTRMELLICFNGKFNYKWNSRIISTSRILSCRSGLESHSPDAPTIEALCWVMSFVPGSTIVFLFLLCL